MRISTILLSFLLVANSVQANDFPEPAWPLEKGTFWIYEGEVRWVEKNQATGVNEIRQKHVIWRSEVADVVHYRNVMFALIHGFPTDLAWSDSKRSESDSLLIQAGPAYYRITRDAAALFQKIRESEARQLPLGDGFEKTQAELFLLTPLAQDQRFNGGTTLGELASDRYCSLVEAVTPFDLAGVKGSPHFTSALEYHITWHSTPDNDEIDFVLGLGITGYSYSHHGTTMEVEVRLKEFGSPVKAAAPAEKTAPAPD